MSCSPQPLTLNNAEEIMMGMEGPSVVGFAQAHIAAGGRFTGRMKLHLRKHGGDKLGNVVDIFSDIFGGDNSNDDEETTLEDIFKER